MLGDVHCDYLDQYGFFGRPRRFASVPRLWAYFVCLFFCFPMSLIAQPSTRLSVSRDHSHAKEEYDEFAYSTFLS